MILFKFFPQGNWVIFFFRERTVPDAELVKKVDLVDLKNNEIIASQKEMRYSLQHLSGVIASMNIILREKSKTSTATPSNNSAVYKPVARCRPMPANSVEELNIIVDHEDIVSTVIP